MRRHDRGFRQTRQHAQYLDHWLNVMKAYKKAISTAASEAAAFLAVLVFRIKAKRGPLGAA
jgi:antirestriction protein ArdC